MAAESLKLLKTLCEIHAPSGNESQLKEYLLNYVRKKKRTFRVQPEIYHGDELQDCLILKFGNPRTAIFAHMDSIGFTVRYENQLLPIGSPEAPAGTLLVGADNQGPIECRLEYDNDHHALYSFGRTIERGTDLTYKVTFSETTTHVQSPYLDNRLGVYGALKIAEQLTDGLICFSCWEEHGGGSVPYLIRFIHEQFRVRQALVLDITWATDGVHPGKGVAISLRDRNIPRKSYVNKIVSIARRHRVAHQLEVEGIGSSDGRELQVSPYPVDWCFVGPPQLNPHTPHEKVHKKDIEGMIRLYGVLMEDL